MLAKILRAFPYAADHHIVELLEEGSLHDIDDDVFDGLEAEGFVEEAPADLVAAAAGEVAIPDGDLSKLPWRQLQTIGHKLGLPRTATKTDVLASIQTELARRGGA